jgi:mRNA interferase RelE/StbE
VTDSYNLVIKKSAERELRAIPKQDMRRIVTRIQGLAQQPRPTVCEKLSGEERYRIRQGDYRIVYAVDDESRTVEVVKIGHRREVYRK